MDKRFLKRSLEWPKALLEQEELINQLKKTMRLAA